MRTDEAVRPQPPRIGVFGGTFDPPHLGHLVTAVNVAHELDLDRVLMVVANEPWQKVDEREISSAADRLAMVDAATAGDDRIVTSDLEVRRGGPSYSVETLGALSAEMPETELFLVVGSDAAAGLATWERADELADLATIVVVERPGATTDVPRGFDVVHVEVPRLEVSSTDLRDRVRTGRPLRHLVPDGVVSLIRERGLYGGPG